MKRLLHFFLFFPVALIAQPRVTQGPAIKTDKIPDIYGIAHETSSGNIFLLYREFNNAKVMSPTQVLHYKWAIDVISPDLKPLHRNKPQNLDIPKGEEIEIGQVVSFEGKPWVIFLLYKKKETETEVYRAPVQTDGTIGKLEKAGKLDGKFFEQSQVMYAHSADNSLFMVAQHPSRNKPKEPFSFLVFDQKGNVRRKGNLLIPKEPEDLTVGYPVVANDGNIWAPVWTYNDGLRQEVWMWTEGAPQPVKTNVAFSKDQIVTDLKLKQSPHDGFMYAGGTFAAASDDAEKGMFKGKKWNNDPNPEQGTLSLKLDSKNGKVISKTMHPFSTATLNFWDEKPDILKKGGGLNSIRAVDLLPLADGSVWVGVEQFYQVFQSGTINYTPQAIGSITDGFLYGDPCSESGILAHHSPTGELSDERILDKHVWAIKDYGLGYFFRTNSRGDLIMLYTDHEDNPGKNITEINQLERSYIGLYGTFKTTACGAMKIAKKDEKSNSKRLFTQNETKTWLEPRLNVQAASNTFVLVCVGNSNTYSLLKLDL